MRVVGNMDVGYQVAGQGSRACPCPAVAFTVTTAVGAVGMVLGDVVMTPATVLEPRLQRLLGIADILIPTKPTKNSINRAIFVAITVKDTVTFSELVSIQTGARNELIVIAGVDVIHHLRPQITREEFTDVWKEVICHTKAKPRKLVLLLQLLQLDVDGDRPKPGESDLDKRVTPRRKR